MSAVEIGSSAANDDKNILPRRDEVFWDKIGAEKDDVSHLLQDLRKKLEEATSINPSPEFIEITWDREGKAGDRRTDYILGVVLSKLRDAGWTEVTHSLIEGNSKIIIWIK
ncbi:MAG: hypothetical protein R3251_01630 [Candidatus Spechtbacterales bacterium]|nr:hypothetical protein [Candidatus Spechtbacterales bacterium]